MLEKLSKLICATIITVGVIIDWIMCMLIRRAMWKFIEWLTCGRLTMNDKFIPIDKYSEEILTITNNGG